jgi:hypothetical protein
MTEAQRIHLKLLAVSLTAVATGVLATFWPGGIVSLVVSAVSWIVVAYVIFVSWGLGSLGRRLSSLDTADAQAAREASVDRHS